MKMLLRLRGSLLLIAMSAMIPLHVANGGPGSLFSAGSNSSRPLALGPVASGAPAYTVIAGGLHNPRGLTFGPNNRLFVAEAGLGGTDTDPVAYNSAIDEIVNPQSSHPTLRTVAFGFPSILTALGDIIGVDGISADGNGEIFAITGESRNSTGNRGFGLLQTVTTSGDVNTLANVGTVNYRFTDKHPELDPGGQYPDANPYGVLALPTHTYAVDAGANTLNEVFSNGKVEILAYFENNITADSTPTCMAQGPDGALYIGTLSLVDSLVFGPSAKVYRVVPEDLPSGGIIIGQESEWATGLWPINGCAFGPDGTFYVSELITSSDFSGGDVVKIPFNDPATHISLTNETLPFGAGVVAASDGTVYAVGLTVTSDGFVARLAHH